MTKYFGFLFGALIVGATVWAVDPSAFRDVKISNTLTVGGVPKFTLGAGTSGQAVVSTNSAGSLGFSTLTVGGGGTGLSSGTSGGIPYYSSTTTLASSALLTNNQLVLGGGAGAAPQILAAGSQYQVLTMGASNPGYGAVNLAQAAAVTGVLPNGNTTATNANTINTIVARDGSGNFTAGTVTANLTGNVTGNVTGTASGNTTYSANNHGVVLSSATNAMTVLAPDASTAKAFVSGGSSADPSWAVLGVAGGGSGLATKTIHSIQVGNGTSAETQLGVGSTGTVLIGTSSSDPSFSAVPVLGATGTTGTLGFSGTTSGTVTIQPQSAAGTYNFNLPITAGSAGQVLTSQAGGTTAMTWTAALTNPMTSTGDMIYSSDNSGSTARLAAGASGRYLQSNGAAAPTWSIFTKPSITIATSTGTTTGYLFTVSGVTVAPTNGATYTNNGHTYTVLLTDSGKTHIWTTQAAAPLASGSLAKVTGTGDGSISFSVQSALATYSAPATASALWVRCAGGGAGGGGTAGASNAGAAGGGGAGAYVEKFIGSPSATYYYQIGANGGASSAGNANGGTPGDTSFTDGTLLLTAGGGTAGQGVGGGSSGVVFNSTKASGGATTGGDTSSTNGMFGGAGIVLSATQAMGGIGGTNPLGIGGEGSQGTGNGNGAGGYGSGGGGAAEVSAGGSKAGGAGTGGVCIIHEFYNGN